MTEFKKPALKEGYNRATLVGTLVEKNLEEGSYTKQDGTVVENIKGSISIRTGEHEVHQVRLQSNKLTNAGKENTLYKGYKTLDSEFVSVADLADGNDKLATLSGVKGESEDTLLYTYKEILKVLDKKSLDTKVDKAKNDKEVLKVSEKNGKYAFDVQYVEDNENQEPLYKVSLTVSEVNVNGKVSTNEYYGRDSLLKQFQQVEGKFVNRLTDKDDATPRATFEVEVFVSKTKPEMDKDGEETGRAIVEGYIPTYNAIEPYKFTVVEEGAHFFLNDVEKGQTIKLYGQIVNKKEEHVKLSPAAFGSEDIKEITYSYVTESLIQNAAMPYEKGNSKAFDATLINERLVKREVYLEQQKNKGQQKAQQPAMASFGTEAKTEKKPNQITGVDLGSLF